LEVPSFFERLTAMALCAFADAAVDVAVIEVGLGGRLDATNVVRPLACAITRLGMDHMEFLGPTLAHIAAEKAGIIKAAVPVVTTTQDPEAAAVIARSAERLGAPLTVVVAGRDSGLRGAHQRDNAAIAAALVRMAGFVTDDDVIAAGLAAVRWPGRYETVGTDPLIIVDGAHDGLAAAALVATIVDDERVAGRALHLVLGVSRGHAPAELVEPLALVPWASVVATQAAHPRALPGSEVARAALRLCSVVDVVADVVDAVAIAVDRARSDGGVVVVTGSLFVVGEARAAFITMPADPQRPAW
jgi:dihydrofolate synthase/folylpolyglutamate synthase